MKLITAIDAINDSQRDTVLAIGNFDGVHKGHQALLHKAREIAEDLGKKVAVLTFEPHPRALFRPDDPPFRLTPAPVKHRRFAAEGMDITFSIGFDWDFASQSAQNFIKTVLDNAIRPAHIVVGDDFRFGQMRTGTPQAIIDAGYKVTVLDKIGVQGADISSSRIRGALRHGHIDEANALLGWEWEIEGQIVKGDQRGRELGYPTANVPLKDTLHPAYGIYATWVHIANFDPPGLWRPSVTNIGIRPMFEVKVGQVESFIFDFDEEIYGKTLRIKPVKRLRSEARFDSLDALIAQMDKDSAQARDVLKKNTTA